MQHQIGPSAQLLDIYTRPNYSGSVGLLVQGGRSDGCQFMTVSYSVLRFLEDAADCSSPGLLTCARLVLPSSLCVSGIWAATLPVKWLHVGRVLEAHSGKHHVAPCLIPIFLDVFQHRAQYLQFSSLWSLTPVSTQRVSSSVGNLDLPRISSPSPHS